MPQSLSQRSSTPAAAGYAMPPEWAPHESTWVSWPHKRDSWPGRFEAVEPTMVRFVEALSPTETIRINVLDAEHETHVRGLLEGRAASQKVRFHHFITDDAWCRDHGAIFVSRNPALGDPLLALDFLFNSWGGKYPPYDHDDAIPPQMAATLGVPCRRIDMVLEGGSIDVNGAGALITTEQCLLHPNRNPAMSRADIETVLRANLGVEHIVWLGDGIAGDDTDGHVDDLTRFVAPDTVVTMVEPDRSDANFEALAANRERLDRVRLADGRPLRVIELRMPRPVEYQGDRLPASYANFYIGNRVVLMPAFNDPMDEPNRALLARCFPEREVIAIDCTGLVLGLGTFHCLTQQVPRA